MSVTASVNPSAIQRWIAEKLDAKKVQEELLAQGCDADSIDEHLKELKKAKYAKRQTAGFIYLGIGSFLGLVSCVVSLVNPIPELYSVFLYGLTSIAIIIIALGLYYVFE